MIKRFLRHTFISREAAEYPSIEPTSDMRHAGLEVIDEIPDIKHATTATVILTINRVIASVLIVSLLFMIVAWLWHPDRRVPDVIPNLVTSTMGYFVGALTNYLDKSSDTRSRASKNRRV